MSQQHNCTLALVLLALLIHCASCNYDNAALTSDNGVVSSMWFGPRLGRRRRSDGGQNADDDIPRVDGNSPAWAYAPYHDAVQGLGDKRRTTQFTPRLGRELSDEFLQRLLSVDPEEMEIYRQELPFASRFGRHLKFEASPRLGRQPPSNLHTF